MLRAYAGWADGAPDAVSTSLRFLRVPDLDEVPPPLRGRAFVAVDGAFLGTPEDGARALAELRALEPELDGFGPLPASAPSHIHMDPEEPTPGLGDGMMIGGLTEAAIRDLLRAAGPSSRSTAST